MSRSLVLSALALTLTGSFAAAEPEAPALAAPRIIVLYGGPLEKPVYLTNWYENLQFMLSSTERATLRPGDVDTTGAIRVAMFWYGPAWEEYARNAQRLPELLSLTHKAQLGSLYLAGSGAPSFLNYHSALASAGLRVIDGAGIALLASHGISAGTSQPALVGRDNAARAAPEVIILHGGPLTTPVTFANWWENLELLGAMDDGSHLSRDAAERLPALEVALFWGSGWGALAKDSAGAARLMGRLDEASHGRIHFTNNRHGGVFIHGMPAADDPDLRSAGTAVRRIAPVGLAILHRRGVPLPGVPDSVLVTGTVQHFHEALFNADSATVLDLLAPDAVVLEGGQVENRAEYRDGHLAADIEYLRTVRTRRGPLHVTVMGDAAWVRSTTTSERTVDGELRRSVGAELMVLSNGERGWRIRAIHWSSGRAN